MIHKLSAIGVAGTVSLTLLAACGSSSKSTTSATQPASAVATTSASAAPKATVKIMVGGLAKQIYLPAKLTEQLGFFKQQNLDVQLSDEPSGVNAEDAMLAGQVNGVVGFYDHNIDLQAKGKSTQSVVQFLQTPGEVELCRTDLKGKIDSPADWKGRSLGITDIGSSTDFLTKYLAVRNGVPVDQIHELGVQAGNTFIAAMQHQTIDCGMTTEPTVSAVLQKNLGYIILDARTATGTQQAFGGVYPASCLYMETSYVQAHPDVVQRLVNAFVQTMHWIQAHSAAEITAEMPADYYAGVGKDAYVSALNHEKGIYTTDGLMPSSGPPTSLAVLSAFNPEVKGKQIDLTKTYDNSFAKKANQTYPS